MTDETSGALFPTTVLACMANCARFQTQQHQGCRQLIASEVARESQVAIHLANDEILR
jgi:hypothetical protein